MPARPYHTIPLFAMLLPVALLWRCRQPYDPPAVKATNQYLVVDGFINTGVGAVTSFNINRTRNLGDSTAAGIPELHAQVSIVGSRSGATWPLTDTANTGTYTSAPLTLDNTDKFSIVVTTSDGKKYSSDPVPCKQTPPIDSVFWRQPDDFTVYIATHDPANATHYYRFDYSETWQHESNLTSPWAVVNGNLVASDSTNQTSTCWTTATSTNVLVATSVALDQDVIDAFPVRTIPNGDPKIDIRYSIDVREYALTEDAYNYWQLIEKTSQSLGTLFDLQPTQLMGNIHSVTNPSEPVIGYISASSVQQLRIFVYQTYLHDWIHNAPAFGCDTIEISYNPNSFPLFSFPDTNYGPYYFNGPTVLILAPLFCLDCTRFGGTTIKPSFWQ